MVEESQDKKSILIVDDVEMNRVILSNTFAEDYHILEAGNGEEALRIIEQNSDRLGAVLLDLVMPVMDGFSVLEEMNRNKMINFIPVFLVTAENSPKVLKRGYELGAVDVIEKPISPFFIKRRISNVIKLNNIVNEQEAMLRKQALKIRELNRTVLETLATAIEFRDCDSGEHVMRISKLTLCFLKAINRFYPEYGVKEEEMQAIADAAVMHDVGKIAIPDCILNKADKLSPEEYEIMKTHTTRGCEMLERVPKMKENPVYEYAYDICRHHHERWDGKGYPDGLKGEEISIWAQAVSIADVYDALVSKRIYKETYPHEVAIRMIVNGECGAFSPMMLDCLCKAEAEIDNIYRHCK